MPQERKDGDCLEEIDKYRQLGFRGNKLQQIKMGLEEGLDVSIYAKPEYNEWQMEQIRLGLKDHIDVGVYAFITIPADEMQHIREKLVYESGQLEIRDEEIKQKRLKKILLLIVSAIAVVGLVLISVIGGDKIKRYMQRLEINLKDSSVEVDYQSMFNPRDYIVDYSEENEVKLSIDSDVDTSKLGLYKVKYTIDNGIKSISKTLDVKVVDKDAPVITLRETNVSMYRTDAFSCEAYIQSATDNVDGDLSKNVKCSSIDTTKDTQVVTYSVEDSQHNKAEATLNLHLSDKPAPTPDVIYVEVPSGNTSQQGNNGSEQIAPSTSTSHGTQYFMFSDGYNLDSGYSACIATGSGYGAYSCEPIMGSDGLYKGYKLTY